MALISSQRYQPAHLRPRERGRGKFVLALAVAAAVAFLSAHASLGLFRVQPASRLAGKAVTARDGGRIAVTATLTDDLVRPLTAQLQVSINPVGAARPWDDRMLEGPVAELTVSPGRSVRRAWTIEPDLPEGSYEAWLWLREFSGGQWVGSEQRRLTGTPIRITRTKPLLRSRVPMGPVLADVRATAVSSNPTSISVTTAIQNTTGGPQPVGLRWGLVPALPASLSTWAQDALKPSGGMRWLTLPPGPTTVVLTGASLGAPGTYHVRVQLLRGPSPSTADDAAAGAEQLPTPLDDVLLADQLEVNPVPTPGLVRPIAPDGPLVVRELSPGAKLVAGEPMQVIVAIENLSDRLADGSVFAVLAPVGSAQPWSEDVAASPMVPVSVAPGASSLVRLRVPESVPAGSYQLSAWVHGATAKTAGTHVDGAISMQAVVVAP